MPHKRVDVPHSQLPRRTRPRGPSPAHLGPWSLPVEPPQRGLLPSPRAPGCAFLLIILSQPRFLSPHGGDTQDTQDQMESLDLGGGQLWPLLGRTQVSGLSWQHQRPCPRGRWVPGRGPCPASKGQPPPPHHHQPVPAFIPSFAHQIWIGRCLRALGT